MLREGRHISFTLFRALSHNGSTSHNNKTRNSAQYSIASSVGKTETKFIMIQEARSHTNNS